MTFFKKEKQEQKCLYINFVCQNGADSTTCTMFSNANDSDEGLLFNVSLSLGCLHSTCSLDVIC
jgi:hypothetical protein